MENTTAKLTLGHRLDASTAPAQLFDGTLGLLAIASAQLSPDDAWHTKELVNAYFGLSL